VASACCVVTFLKIEPTEDIAGVLGSHVSKNRIIAVQKRRLESYLYTAIIAIKRIVLFLDMSLSDKPVSRQNGADVLLGAVT